MLIYLVEQSWGSYDDYATHIDSVYASRELAEKRCSELKIFQDGPLTLEQIKLCRKVANQLDDELDEVEYDDYYEDRYISMFEERTNIKYEDYTTAEEHLAMEYHDPVIIEKVLITDKNFN